MSSPRATNRPLLTEGGTTGRDEFDDLFNDDGLDVFRDLEPAKPISTKDNSSKGLSGAGLGIDEEVEITRKPRAPRVKLDENRLLSQAGIPKLRKRAKGHLKFKGKGHEYSDAARLLSFYQLWLDDLFPKAKFLDALAMVEKMGHKKRMQTMRTEWINEGKPRSSVHEESIFDEPALPPRENDERAQTAPRIAPIFETTASKRPKTPMADTEMDDIYDATPRLARTTQVEANSLFVGGNGSIFGPAKDIDDEPPGDDLDALLAEEETLQNAPEKIQVGATESRQVIPREDDFDDEMEAMAEMDGTW